LGGNEERIQGGLFNPPEGTEANIGNGRWGCVGERPDWGKKLEGAIAGKDFLIKTEIRTKKAASLEKPGEKRPTLEVGKGKKKVERVELYKKTLSSKRVKGGKERNIQRSQRVKVASIWGTEEDLKI